MSQESTNPTSTWYYEWSGQRLGPMTQHQMLSMIAKGTLAYGNLVWRAGLPTWEKIENTELRAFLHQTAPPPMSGDGVKNATVWTLAFSPLLSVVLGYTIANFATNGNEAAVDRLMQGNHYWYIAPLLSLSLSYWDARQLKKAGWDMTKLGQVWLIPVYLFKRAKLARHNLAYFWTWLGLFLLSLTGV